MNNRKEQGEMISVIVPIYNVEKYLINCIESIRNQSYTNIEIILVDDGSPDRCPEICDKYKEKDDRIIVIHKENGGLSDARNAGLEIAKGEYIGFVDSDDFIHPDMYLELLNALKKTEADIAVCKVKTVYDNEVVMETMIEKKYRLYNGIQAIENVFDAQLYLESVVSWNKLYKKNLFDNIRFPKGKIHEDEFTTYRLFYDCKRIVYCENKYYYYLQRSDSIMGKNKMVYSEDMLEAYEQMGQFFAEKDEQFILQLVKYRYLCLIKKYIELYRKKKERNDREEEIFCVLKEKYKKEYGQYIKKIKKMRRRFRLRIYRWFGVSF